MKYIHGFNIDTEGHNDSHMSSLLKGISGNQCVKDLRHARMQLTKYSLSLHLKLLETNPGIIVEFVQDNEEIYRFRVLQDIRKLRTRICTN